MPTYKKNISVTNLSTNTILPIALHAIENLGWEVEYVTPDRIIGKTSAKWNKVGQDILIVLNDSELMIQSEMNNGAIWDLFGKNKATVQKFEAAFIDAKTSVKEDTITGLQSKIESLQDNTMKTLATQEKEMAEVDQAMNLSTGNSYITYGIIAINVIIFILMALQGAGIFEANGLVHLKWGSNFKLLTESGDWWRLISCVFIHFGIIHLVMNMYSLLYIGIYLEPMLGKARYLIAYLCTGVFASLMSLWWHTQSTNSAGASGAIFGMYGLFLALLTTSLIPKIMRQAMLQSIGIFVFYNLVYGMKSGVDNAAHIGGLLSGFVIGYLYAFAIKKEKKENIKMTWLNPLVVIVTIGAAFLFLNSHKVDETERMSILNEMDSAGYKDNDLLNAKFNLFDKLHNSTDSLLFSDTTLTDADMEKRIDETATPNWDKADSIIQEASALKISPADKLKTEKIKEYISYKKKELAIIKRIIANPNDPQLMEELNKNRAEAQKIFASALNN